jgi:hypothetical protein
MDELKLFPWQPEGVEFLRTHPGAILGDEQGLGKTIMVIEAAKNYDGPVLCIVRPLAKYQIVQMIKDWDPGAPIVRCVESGVFAEDVVKSWFEFPRKRGYLLVHHEAVRLIAQKLKEMGLWEIVWVDEVHRISNHRSQISKAVKSIQAFYRWGTSGTIQDRSPADFWSILNWQHPNHFTSYWAFYNLYVEEVRGHNGQTVNRRPKNMAMFAKHVGPLYLRRTATEVGMQEPLYEDIPLEMYPKQQAVYDKLAHDTLVYLERESTDDPFFISNSLQKLYMLQLSTIATELVDVPGPSVKLDYIKDWLEDYPVDQAIVFTHSKKACSLFASLLPEAFGISGDTSNSDRERYLKMFESGKFRVLFAVTDLAAESLSLPTISNAFFLDTHPSSRMMLQAEMRIRRANSVKRAHIRRLLCTKSVDFKLLQHCRNKITSIDLVNEFLRRSRDA